MAITLSYIMTTYNKLPYLKITLSYLINTCKADEEIVITDGGSADGTKEYLAQLLAEKKIHQYISEKDFGEAHGTNKAILMAKGKLIKIISDDDLFHYPTIDAAKKFMLVDETIDLIGYDGFGHEMNSDKANKRHVWKSYLNWKTDKKPFVFCGLSIIFRKDKLSYLGLLNPTQIAVDFEYTLRITSLKKLNFRWIKNWAFINIKNEDSNSTKFYNEVYLDSISNLFYYKYKKKIKHVIKKNIIFAFNSFIKKEDEKELIKIENWQGNLVEKYSHLNNFLHSQKNSNELL